MEKVYKLHKRDPNFPLSVINKIEAFLSRFPVTINLMVTYLCIYR